MFLLSRYFRTARYSSFSRQLSLYGFRRLKKGSDKDSWYNEYFLRGRPDLAAKLKIREKHQSLKTPNPSISSDDEPDLRTFSLCEELSSSDVARLWAKHVNRQTPVQSHPSFPVNVGPKVDGNNLGSQFLMTDNNSRYDNAGEVQHTSLLGMTITNTDGGGRSCWQPNDTVSDGASGGHPNNFPSDPWRLKSLSFPAGFDESHNSGSGEESQRKYSEWNRPQLASADNTVTGARPVDNNGQLQQPSQPVTFDEIFDESIRSVEPNARHGNVDATEHQWQNKFTD